MIRVDGVTVSYRGALALQDASLTAERGVITTVVGRNGAGKTTLLRAIAGTVARSAGTVSLDDVPLPSRPGAVARTGVQFVPESRNVFGDLSVLDNLKAGTLGCRRAAGRQVIDGILDDFAILRPLLSRKARLLSGGERQSLAVARALACRPSALLLDEPSLGLSAKWAREVLALVARIAAERDLVVLVAEQNAALVARVSARLVALETGRVHAAGPARQVLDRPEFASLLDG